MTDPNQRIANWQIKTDTARMKETLDTLRPEMLKRYEASVVSLCEMEVKARQTLNAAGVHTILYVAYLNYARQLYKFSRQQGISGESFAMGAQVLLDKRSARGGDTSATRSSRRSVDVSPSASARRNSYAGLRCLCPDAVSLPMLRRVIRGGLSPAPTANC